MLSISVENFTPVSIEKFSYEPTRETRNKKQETRNKKHSLIFKLAAFLRNPIKPLISVLVAALAHHLDNGLIQLKLAKVHGMRFSM
jgi:hypothetical protein